MTKIDQIYLYDQNRPNLFIWPKSTKSIYMTKIDQKNIWPNRQTCELWLERIYRRKNSLARTSLFLCSTLHICTLVVGDRAKQSTGQKRKDTRIAIAQKVAVRGCRVFEFQLVQLQNPSKAKETCKTPRKSQNTQWKCSKKLKFAKCNSKKQKFTFDAVCTDLGSLYASTWTK